MSDAPPNHDLLRHDAMAQSVHRATLAYPHGAVLAVQGPWGRGKSDVLQRVHGLESRAQADRDPLRQPIRLNPWAYQQQGFLQPLLDALEERKPPAESPLFPGWQRMAASVVSVGTALGLGFGTDIGARASIAVAGLANTVTASLADTVSKYAETKRNRPLNPDALGLHGERLLVLIDDMDRASPDRQIAWLEALYFLKSFELPCVYVVFVDSEMLAVSLRDRYGKESGFEPQRYLDKIFDLRMDLPPVDEVSLDSLHAGHLQRRLGQGTIQDQLTSRLGLTQPAAPQVPTPLARELANPRFLRRLFDRLALISICAEGPAELGDDPALMYWFYLRSRLPQLRAAEGDATLLAGWVIWGQKGDPVDPVALPELARWTDGDRRIWRLAVLHADDTRALRDAAAAWGRLLAQPGLAHL
jgi:hypothetical protein